MFGILIVDQDRAFLDQLEKKLSFKHRVFKVSHQSELLPTLQNHMIDVVFLGDILSFEKSVELVEHIHRLYIRTTLILMTEKASEPDARLALQSGAYNLFSKTYVLDDPFKILNNVKIAHDTITGASILAPKMQKNELGLSSRSNEMNRIYHLIEKIAKVNTPVLLRGESGTGKEVLAKAIHLSSSRKDQKFVAINCSAITETLIESELFGHEKGSFTGAIQKKIGKFQYAQGGTLFLDEVGDISLSMQVKLLRVLQDQVITPVGSNQEIHVDVRLIAATHQDLELMLKKQTMREDFFYRLSVLPVFIPPLRERKEDVESLVSYFINKFNEIHPKKIAGVDEDTLNVLKEYHWPGNIRELRNVIEHAFVLESSNVITSKSLPEKLFNPFDKPNMLLPNSDTMALDDFISQKEMFERQYIMAALKRNDGKINQTSRQTKIPKKTLLRKIEKYKIDPAHFKSDTQ